MSKFREKRPPELKAISTHTHSVDDAALEGVAANVKLLLKLIQDHKDACKTQRNDGKRMLRVAGMMTILDMVRTRIQKCQSFGSKRGGEPSRQSPCQSPRDKRLSESILGDEKENLKRELGANLAARKSLEIMCSSLGKEKEIMMGELTKKAHVLAEMEEHINNLKAQNETLLAKVHNCVEVHKDVGKGKEKQGTIELQEHDKSFSKQLSKSSDEYRSMKIQMTEVQEENMVMRSTMEEMAVKVGCSLEKIQNYRKHLTTKSDEIADIEEGVSELEHMFKCFGLNEKKHGKKSEQVKKPNKRS